MIMLRSNSTTDDRINRMTDISPGMREGLKFRGTDMGPWKPVSEELRTTFLKLIGFMKIQRTVTSNCPDTGLC